MSTDERIERLRRDGDLEGALRLILATRDRACDGCRNGLVSMTEGLTAAHGRCAGTGLVLRPLAELAAYSGARWAFRAFPACARPVDPQERWLRGLTRWGVVPPLVAARAATRLALPYSCSTCRGHGPGDHDHWPSPALVVALEDYDLWLADAGNQDQWAGQRVDAEVAVGYACSLSRDAYGVLQAVKADLVAYCMAGLGL